MPPNPPRSVKSRERSEFKEAKAPVDNIEFKETGLLTTIDRLSNIMFMAEIFRAVWLSFEVCSCRCRKILTAFQSASTESCVYSSV